MHPALHVPRACPLIQTTAKDDTENPSDVTPFGEITLNKTKMQIVMAPTARLCVYARFGTFRQVALQSRMYDPNKCTFGHYGCFAA